jgi:hypothetical protein
VFNRDAPCPVVGAAAGPLNASVRRRLEDEPVIPSYPEEVRDAFGWFGAAAHNAQFFEGDLITLHLLVAAAQGKATTEPQLRDLELARSRKTLGQLLRALDHVAPVPAEARQLWDHALELRNGLIHGFFWRNHSRLLSPTGCKEVARELRDAAILFTSASAAAQDAMERCIAVLGIDREDWNRQVSEELAGLFAHGGA